MPHDVWQGKDCMSPAHRSTRGVQGGASMQGAAPVAEWHIVWIHSSRSSLWLAGAWLFLAFRQVV